MDSTVELELGVADNRRMIGDKEGLEIFGKQPYGSSVFQSVQCFGQFSVAGSSVFRIVAV